MLILRVDFLKKGKMPCGLLMLALLSITACQKAPRHLTDAVLRHRADSVVRENTDLLQKQFDEDLDRRMSIEVRPLADSFLKK